MSIVAASQCDAAHVCCLLLQDTWSHVEFKFTQHKGTDVYLVKMAEEDFEALEDNQVLVQVCQHHNVNQQMQASAAMVADWPVMPLDSELCLYQWVCYSHCHSARHQHLHCQLQELLC